MAAEDSLRKMVKTIKKDKGYKILTTKEYEDLLACASTSGEGGGYTTSTPKPSGEKGRAKPKVPTQTNSTKT